MIYYFYKIILKLIRIKIRILKIFENLIVAYIKIIIFFRSKNLFLIIAEVHI